MQKRNRDLKRREGEKLPPERLRSILSRIYPEETVNELMDRFVENKPKDERSNNNAE